jgi:hypothetical protein
MDSCGSRIAISWPLWPSTVTAKVVDACQLLSKFVSTF